MNIIVTLINNDPPVHVDNTELKILKVEVEKTSIHLQSFFYVWCISRLLEIG